MEFIPPGLFQGVGVLAVLVSILVTSWWLLVRGTLHTDTEFQFVVKENEWLKQALTESQSQSRELIEANRTITHALEGFRVAVEEKK